MAPGQDAASSAAKPSSSVASRRRPGSGSIAVTTGAAPPISSWSIPCQPARARSHSQPRAATSRFTGRSAPSAAVVELLGAGPPDRLLDPLDERVVHGTQQRRACGGQRHVVVLVRGSRRGLLRRLGDPPGQRRPGDGARQPGQSDRLRRLRTQQPAHEHLVEPVHGGQRIVQPFDGVGQQIRSHHATAPVVGNQCISGTGAVVGANSR